MDFRRDGLAGFGDAEIFARAREQNGQSHGLYGSSTREERPVRALVACALFLPFLELPAVGQVVEGKPRAVTAAAARAAHADTRPGELRVTHVSLYKNGVGFFEHEGQVTGDAAVSLDLTSAQLNDVLQSLTAVDVGGGHVTGANYNSTTPLDQQLRTLPLNLGEAPSEEDLFAALRGARVEVTGSGAVFTGRLLSMEVRTAGAPNGDDSKPVPQRRFATVVADSGATRTVELTPNTVVRLLDAGLRADLNTYLELLDRNRTEGIRHLVLTDRGTGTRALRVSFLSEVPVWKSTYRLLLTTGATGGVAKDGTATVQGFSVVDNTTGEDWKDVRLSLIAGSPQSFLQPISQPIYDRRPEVAIAENAQTTPQTHESSEAEIPQGSASADLSSGSAGGNPASLFGSPTGTGSGTGGTVAAAAKRRVPTNRNMMKDTGSLPAPMANMAIGGPMPMPYEQAVRQSNDARATTAAFDDFFAYNLTDPVTIPRNGSALVPILQERLPVESVTLWSRGEARPLRALWVTNSSGLTLDRGSFSVVENGAFAGEGLVDPVHPGERRLLSYAVDQAVRVTPENGKETQRITNVSVSKGVLRAANTEVAEARYTVSDAAPEGRTVIVEEPRRPGWTLDPADKPAEVTPGVYRFRVPVEGHGKAELTVTQRRVVDQYFRLADSSEEQLMQYLQGNGGDTKILAQLEPVFAAKRRLAELDARVAEAQEKERVIGEDQKRLRENLAALKGSAEERALVRRYTEELNAQEDALGALKRDLASLEQARSAAAQELADRIDSIQIPGVA